VIFVLLGVAARRARRDGTGGVTPVVPEGPEIS